MYHYGDLLHPSLHYIVKCFISTNLNRQVTDYYVAHNPAHLTREQRWAIVFPMGPQEPGQKAELNSA